MADTPARSMARRSSKTNASPTKPVPAALSGGDPSVNPGPMPASARSHSHGRMRSDAAATALGRTRLGAAGGAAPLITDAEDIVTSRFGWVIDDRAPDTKREFGAELSDPSDFEPALTQKGNQLDTARSRAAQRPLGQLHEGDEGGRSRNRFAYPSQDLQLPAFDIEHDDVEPWHVQLSEPPVSLHHGDARLIEGLMLTSKR